MIIEKPFGTTLEEARELNAARAVGLRGAPGLPHRPLPGQGDRPEHDGVPVRQRHVRAAVEPQLHRQRPDHRGRGHRHRLARRLLRPRRRAARPRPEPHAPAAVPRGDGAAGATSPPTRCATRRSRSCTRSAAPTPEDVDDDRGARAVRAPGTVGGEDVPGYLEEEGVPPDSNTETYAALRLEVDNWRWAGVPFYLRTGKRLARKVTEIAVTLKPVPHLAFQQDGSVGVQPNQLILTLQPNEGVSLSLGAKIPGTRMRIRPVNMEFLYGTSFLSQSPEAYERLIIDAMRGDATLFTRNDEVEAQWRICDPIVQTWEATPGPAAAVRGRHAGPGRGRRAAARRATTGGRSERRRAGRQRQRLERPGHDARRRSRRRCASMLAGAPPRERGLRPGARAQPRLRRRQGVERRDRQPPAAASGATTRRARSCCRSTPRRDAHRRRGHDRLRRAPEARASSRCCARRSSSTSASATCAPRTRSSTRSWSPTCRRSCGRRTATTRRSTRCCTSPRSCCWTPSTSPTPRDALRRARASCSRSAYVVDLAWLRSTPWRERVAATFDPPKLRPDLRDDQRRDRSATTPSRRPPALLLVGWLASRLAGS